MAERSPNESIAKMLQEISDYYSLELTVLKREKIEGKKLNDSRFSASDKALSDAKIKKGVYSSAAAKIRDYPKRLKRIAPGIIPGIGKSISTDINEFLEDGECKRLKDLQDQYGDIKDSIALFTKIDGIGPKRALDYTLKGYRTVEDIPEEETTKEIRLGIAHYEDSHISIPRAEIIEIEKKVGESFADLGCKFKIAGSYRRKEATSGDVDILVSKCDMEEVVEALDWLIGDIISQGEVTLRAYTKEKGYRVDIKIVPRKSFPFALMHYTGSFKFNQLMRQRAIEYGYRLNEYGLFPRDEKEPKSVKLKKESEIFDFLDVVYLPPSKRLKTITEITYTN